jgi:hypothetical protein
MGFNSEFKGLKSHLITETTQECCLHIMGGIKEKSYFDFKTVIHQVKFAGRLNFNSLPYVLDVERNSSEPRIIFLTFTKGAHGSAVG